MLAGADELGVLRLGEGMDEIGEILWGFVLEEWFSPFDEIGEIHICGEVLESRVLVDSRAFDFVLE